MKKNFSWLFALLLFITSCAEETQQDSDQFFDDKDSTEVNRLTIINDSLEKQPDNLSLVIEKGEICKENLDFECALGMGAKAFRLDSTNLDARKLYAWSLINKPNTPVSDIEMAQRHFKYILSERPNDVKTLIDLGNTYALTGDFQTALKYTNDGLRIDKNYRDGYVLKGSIYKTLENYDLALSSYQTALQLDPTFFIGYLHTGWLLTEMEEHKKALEYYESARQMQPDNINALYGIAKSNQDIGDYEEALDFYREIIDIDKNFYIAYFNQGYIKQYYQKELDSAEFYYDKVIDINPDYVRAWYQLGETYYAQGERSKAARAYTTCVKLDENFEPARIAAQKLKNID